MRRRQFITLLGGAAAWPLAGDDPKMKARLADLGSVPMPMSPAEFGKLIAESVEKWGKVIRDANIKPD